MTTVTDIANPSSLTPPPPPRGGSATVLRECAICQSSIYPSEETHPCPKCGLVFHAECWQENFGCASYGCDQVSVLAPTIDIPGAAAAHVELPPPVDAPVEPLPWDYLLLGAAALAMMASMLSYGMPSLLAIGGVAWRMHRRRGWRNGTLIAAATLCLVGIVGGVALSRFWFTHDYSAIVGGSSGAGGAG